MTLRPPPLYAYPRNSYVFFDFGMISSGAGYAMAPLMLSWLMMNSGLNHQPSSVARSASTGGGKTRLSLK